MTTNWYIARNKQKFGPFSIGQLQQLAVLGMVQPTEYVLPEGAGKWVAATTVEGLFPAVEVQKKYWLSVDGKAQGPHSRELVRAGLLRRQFSGETLACPEGDSRWTPLAQLTDFQEYVPVLRRSSEAHLGVGSSHLDLTGEEAELHMAGKKGDQIARLISTLLDLKRRYHDNPSMVEIIEKNIHDLKAIRERGTSKEGAGTSQGN